MTIPHANPAWVNPKAVAQAIEQFRPATIGVKVRLAESIEGDKDLDILKKAAFSVAGSFARHAQGRYLHALFRRS